MGRGRARHKLLATESIAIDISQSECQPLVYDAVRFTAKFSLQIFGLDIFV